MRKIDEKTKSTQTSVSGDTVRRMTLNAEINPRQTIYGEAENETNPITGNPYGHRHLPDYDTSTLEQLHKDNLNAEVQASNDINPITGNPYLPKKEIPLLEGEDKDIIYALEFHPSTEIKRPSYNIYDILGNCITDPYENKIGEDHGDPRTTYQIRFVNAPTSEEIELQRALGRMDVRDRKLHRLDYDSFLRNLGLLSKKYVSRGMPIEVITNPEVLMKEIDKIEFLTFFPFNPFFRGFKNSPEKFVNKPLKEFPPKEFINKPIEEKFIHKPLESLIRPVS